MRNKRLASMTGFFIIFLGLMTLTCPRLTACSLASGQTHSFLASWYSTDSLKKEGTYAYSHGQCADGSMFRDGAYTCATCDWPLGVYLRVSYGQRSVLVKVTDRTNKRFKGKRIDLSKQAFSDLAPLSKGLIRVNVQKDGR